MDLSNHNAFDEIRAAASASDDVQARVDGALERAKAERESDLMGPAMAGSVTLVVAAWSAGALAGMIIVALLRLLADICAQKAARRLMSDIDAGRDYRAARLWSERIALFTGAGWGLSIWPVHDRLISTIGGLAILASVHIVGIMVTFMTAPSPRTLRCWLAGWVVTMTMPFVVQLDVAALVYVVGPLMFVVSALWVSGRIHDQARQTLILQFENQKLAEEVGVINEALAHSLAAAERIGRQDSLTGLSNRRTFEEHAVSLHSDCGAAGKHLLLVDLDHFKTINDRFGHAMGDAVLSSVSTAIGGALKSRDTCARWGGEEFVALLLDCSAEEAIARAEALRESISATQFAGSPDAMHAVTASIGIASWRADETLEELIARADHAMYQAKSSGRNRATYAG